MIRVALLFAAGAVGVALLAPSVFDGATAPSTAGSGRLRRWSKRRRQGRGNRQAAGFREASIEANPRGQFSAEALVNGLPVRMMIDTGASVVTISAATAAHLSLAEPPGRNGRSRPPTA